jgi:hypothetical protein
MPSRSASNFVKTELLGPVRKPGVFEGESRSNRMRSGVARATWRCWNRCARVRAPPDRRVDMKEQDVELVNVSGSIWQKHGPRLPVGALSAPGFRSPIAHISGSENSIITSSSASDALKEQLASFTASWTISTRVENRPHYFVRIPRVRLV